MKYLVVEIQISGIGALLVLRVFLCWLYVFVDELKAKLYCVFVLWAKS